ncbi:ANTAR domain-containing response regulator [Pseudomonas sp. Marseille-Q5115]|uniref:ANTAR domain-containing response regulator n=1 Tax=Pseudomonas sp. Marseille-Q5115 TaxID=2866593 RepID=UPI001CE3DDF4|nr:ANTAR domain-containing protein [Pseudomonas sp. Marseille-Q5115]
MLRILLIDDTEKKLGRLRNALSGAGFEVMEASGLTIDLPGEVERLHPDVILIDTDSPGRDVMEQVILVNRDRPSPIVLFTDEHDPHVMRQAIRAGVSAYIVEGIHAERLQPILDVAIARFETDQALRAQLSARDQQLAERKRIELAKGLLMKLKACDEAAAYTLMRRQAMSRQQKLIQVAEQIIAMNEMLG